VPAKNTTPPQPVSQIELTQIRTAANRVTTANPD
jgi:hypothetical protein